MGAAGVDQLGGAGHLLHAHTSLRI
jgi:hypothetical protein